MTVAPLAKGELLWMHSVAGEESAIAHVYSPLTKGLGTARKYWLFSWYVLGTVWFVGV